MVGDGRDSQPGHEPRPPAAAGEPDIHATELGEEAGESLGPLDESPWDDELSPERPTQPLGPELPFADADIEAEPPMFGPASLPPPAAKTTTEEPGPIPRGSRQPAPRPAEIVARPRRLDAPAISPRMTAVFGALFGLATVASIFALLIQVFPTRGERVVLSASTTAGASSATASSVPQAVPKRAERVALPGPWRLSELEKDPATRIVRGEMGSRSFITALGEAKVPTSEIYRVLKSLDGVVKLDRPGKRDKFAVALSRPASKVVAFEYEVSPVEIYQSRQDEGGLLRGTKLDLKVGTSEYAAAFYLAKDVQHAYRAAGFDDGVLGAIDKAFYGRISSEAFEEGGVVRGIFVELTALGLFVRYERALAVEYRPPDPASKPTRAYWFEGQTYKGYVDERGRAPSELGWRSPVPGAPVTSPFNPKRMHPVLHKVMPHQGTDFGAPAGTPVYAAFRGVVQSASYAGGYGNLVIIDHPGGISTYYGHLSRFAAGLKSGQKVGTHQLIGYVGSTGRSTGPHLHFGAKKDGKFFDSAKLDLDAWRPLPATDRAAFLAVKQQLDQRLEAIGLPEPPPEPERTPSPSGSAAASGAPAPDTEPAAVPSEEPDGEEPEADEQDEQERAAKGPAAKGTVKSPTANRSGGSGAQLVGEDLSRAPE